MAREKNDSQKYLKIRSYNLYTDFLAHLYEFYVGCIKRDRHSLNDIKAEDCDKILVYEAQKLLNLAAARIERGDAPAWENSITVYKTTIPSEFGKHFRWIRNRHNHVDLRRASGEEITLSDFFQKYHFFIYQLYAYPSWLWSIRDIDGYDMKDIERFCISASPSARKGS